METKSIFKSKTFWLNIVTFALAIFAITDPSAMGINPAQFAWVAAVLNIVLRFLTNKPVSLTGGVK